MTHEQELIELLDKEKIDDTIFCEHPLSHRMQGQINAIEATFRKFELHGMVFHAERAPQVNCFDFSIGPNDHPSAYRGLKANIQMAVGTIDGVRMLVPTSDMEKTK